MALPDFLARYRVAWETHNVDLIEQLFAEDAVYEEKPGEKALRGIGEITDYWLNLRTTQSDVHFTVDRFIEAEGSVVAEWHASFVESKSREITLHGILWANLVDGKVTRFVEYFRKSVSGS